MDSRADLLSRAVREHPVVVEPRTGHRCSNGAHAHLGDGRLACWSVPSGRGEGDDPVGCAVDAELVGQPVPTHVAARWSGGRATGSTRSPSFWELWCATEVLAKLADVPMVVLAGAGPVTASPVRRNQVEVHWVVRRFDDLVVAQGLSWALSTSELRTAELT